MLRAIVLSSLVPVALAPCAADPCAAGAVRRPPMWWRVRQAVKLALPGRRPRLSAWTASGVLGFLAAMAVWPLTCEYLIPFAARVGRAMGLTVLYAELRGRVVNRETGEVTDYGLLCRRVVTTAGVNFLASAFDNTVEPEVMKYHGFGTGNTAEAVGDTALVTELTTQYATDNTRPTGSQAHSSNTYTTVGTLSPDATVTIQEHGIFSQAATGGGTLWDRSVFTGIGLTASTDSLQATYVLTLPSGG